jgi:beta-xylosidase
MKMNPAQSPSQHSLAPKPASSAPWVPDLGDGTFQNPILFADYPDPDIIRVGEDFYMTASSFNAVPALPVLHSRDLVNWDLVNYAVRAFPDDYYDTPQHGNGVYAPSLRHHDGWFYIYWGDPDRGIFRVKTQDPLGEWESPIRINSVSGSIDPCPLWDDDGKVYLVHAFAGSRAGVNSLLQVIEMNEGGSGRRGKRKIVFNGSEHHPVIEGPKFLKRNGYYYIFAPAGGVATGWQTVLRSKDIWGPYEDKIVLAQGDTDINGPHQGGYVELENGGAWFLHFQERQPYGRIVHLQPVTWVDDWPVIGNDIHGNGTGQPFLKHAKPNPGDGTIRTPVVGDTFEGDALSLAWQWQAQPRSGWYSLRDNQLRLNAAYPVGQPYRNLWFNPQLLLQKLPAPAFTVGTRFDPSNLLPGERGGLVMMGVDYAAVFVERTRDGSLTLHYAHCKDAPSGAGENMQQSVSLPSDMEVVKLRCKLEEGGLCVFSWSVGEGAGFQDFAESFQAVEGKWIGAKIGLFIEKSGMLGEKGWIDFDYVRIG